MTKINAKIIPDYIENRFGDCYKYTRVGIVELRFALFCFSILIYAVLSSPTPQYFGWPELLCGVGILVAMGLRRPLLVLSGLNHRGVEGQIPASRFGQGAVLFFIYGATIPVISAFINGNDVGMIWRDSMAFLFLAMPFLFGPLMVRRWSFLPILTGMVFLLGLIFAVRAIYSPDVNDLYLEISPSVLFCALLSVAALLSILMDRKYILCFPILVAGIYFPFIAMADNMQRASIGFIVLYTIMVFAIALWIYPRKAWILFLVVGIGSYCFYDYLMEIYIALESKNSIVGFNMRLEEFSAVIKVSDGNLWNIIFGCGWGCSFNSPAVGGLSVNFTHNLFSFYLLKTGALGVFLLIIYLIPIVEALKRLLWYRPALALVFICVMAINIILYASFKSFDFGLILLLITGWGARAVQAAEDEQTRFFRLI